MMDWQWSGTKKPQIREMHMPSVIWAGCMSLAEGLYKIGD